MAKAQPFQQITGRDNNLKNTDKSALYAIVQAAVNVELFTIPLYMTSLYSLHGTHQITGQNNDFYLGRMWPGMSTTTNPKSGNEKAFNALFCVFIAEMLHLQMASNICKAIGVTPSFTSPLMMDQSTYGWKCYGPTNTVIPHILNLKDTKSPYNKIKVDVGAVNKNQLALFLAIEETEDNAEKIITDKSKYFPKTPFDNWNPKMTEVDLPMFGSIGYMYLTMFRYMAIRYEDNTTLWDYVFQSGSLQRDVFNANTPPSHVPEYPTLRATIDQEKQDAALKQVIDMIQGITDQGEGKGVLPEIKELALAMMLAPQNQKPMLMAVQPNFQPNAEAMETDYPTYDEKGVKLPKSRDAAARVKYGKMDHFETFEFVKELFDKNELYTWEQWHKDGKTWTAAMLQTSEHVKNKYPIPEAEDVAGALNRLKQNDPEKNYQMLSSVVAGAIKGVTTVLNDYWNGKTATFPFPSMSGSGDRMSLCWAVFGKAPDLSLGIEPKTPGILYHACQGLNMDHNNPDNPAHCAAVAVYHTCKGSNTCAAEGGCGFVQNVKGGGSCSGSGSGCGGKSPAPASGNTPAKQPSGCGASGHPSSCGAPVQPSSGCGSKSNLMAMRNSGKPGPANPHTSQAPTATANGCGKPAPSNGCGGPAPSSCGVVPPTGPVYYSAPSDNKCASFGGCAVPISASQLFPATPDGNKTTGQMELFNFLGSQFQSTPINYMDYNAGDLVYDVAWNAYIAVLQARNRPIPAKPKPSDIRLAFPPST